MESLFLDTSFILGLEDADDQNHEQAISYWKGFTNRPRKLVTTTYVFDETVTFLKRRMGYKKAVEVGNRLLESPTVEMIHVSPEDFESSWKLFLKYEVQR